MALERLVVPGHPAATGSRLAGARAARGREREVAQGIVTGMVRPGAGLEARPQRDPAVGDPLGSARAEQSDDVRGKADDNGHVVIP